MNEKQVAILEKGVDTWNRWRIENKDVAVDLSGAYLYNANLCGVNLSGAFLRLVELSEADLRNADLNWVNISDAKLNSANLSGASLSQANLGGTNLFNANLSNANLMGASLIGAYLAAAKLFNANLRMSVLRGVSFHSANLSKADLTGADLEGADLYRANLTGVRITRARLNEAKLVESDFSEALLTGVVLYGTARDGWNVQNVKCEYVFWDKTARHRCPSDRDFEPGEFEWRYSSFPSTISRDSRTDRRPPEGVKHDAFICHASEDKDSVARPLAERLCDLGYWIWFDEFSLEIGDSLRRSIDRGLVNSRFGIIILSPSFFAKEWPQYELDGLNALERDGKKLILPVWHGLTRADVLAVSPPLADKVAGNTSTHTVEELAEQIARVLARK